MIQVIYSALPSDKDRNIRGSTGDLQEVRMAKRVCDVCGKDKDVSGGKTCEKGHFVCKDDVYSGVIIISEKAYCPICKKPLR
jgi:hypothetical protein